MGSCTKWEIENTDKVSTNNDILGITAMYTVGEVLIKEAWHTGNLT